MSMKAILDRVEWKPITFDVPVDPGNTLPVATHEGIMKIGAMELKVYQLSDGHRIVAEEDMNLLFAACTGVV
jgi:hypothetical protein